MGQSAHRIVEPGQAPVARVDGPITASAWRDGQPVDWTLDMAAVPAPDEPAWAEKLALGTVVVASYAAALLHLLG